MTAPGTIAHYRITGKLGEGGMGAVYRATDTKLNRNVAIKVLPDSFAADPDRLARFTREAQVLASLNHPNIAAIYGVEERALILELVEGPTLAERIAQGPIPLDEALPIARQIAEALEYAHEKSIVHRDLKPANLKVTPEGRVKVLDFGLAKALSAEPSVAAASASSPTMTMRATMAGMIMGTAAYMSPEQAKGKPVDRRADIWAYGVVLMEMLTGRTLHTGESVSETLASVMRDRPDFSTLPAATPPSVRRMLQRCLDKDPQRRLRDIGEARVSIEDAQSGEPSGEVSSAATLERPTGRRVPVWVPALLAVAVVALAAFLWQARRPVLRPMMRFNVELGPNAVRGAHFTAILSPDGTRLAYTVRSASGSRLLATRLLDQSVPTILAGTEGAADPFFSPDGQWIGFFAEAKLKKISVQGGAPVILSGAPSLPRGASWGEDGNIIACLDSLHLFRIPESGGSQTIIAKPEDRGVRTYRWPQILPGGDGVMATAGSPGMSAATGGYDEANIDVISLRTGTAKTVQKGGYFGRFLPSGYLIYIHQGTLFAVPFDLGRLETRGVPVPLLDNIAATPAQAAGQLDFSQTGTLVYLSGKTSGAEPSSFVWLDGTGKIQPLLTFPNGAVVPRLSPDGKLLAFATMGDLSIYDLQREVTTRITFKANAQAGNREPVWMPDGKHLVFVEPGDEGQTIWWIRADGSGKPEKLFESSFALLPRSTSPDGRLLAFAMQNRESGFDLWMLPLDLSDPEHPKPGKPELFLKEPGDQFHPTFSPDGHWIAYASTLAGDTELFVRPFPAGGGGKWQISTGGGRIPVWSRTQNELFYRDSNQHIMAAGFKTNGGSFSAEKPRLWSPMPLRNMVTYWNFDMAPDGKRAVVIPPVAEGSPQEQGNVHVTVVLNFFDELKRRLP